MIEQGEPVTDVVSAAVLRWRWSIVKRSGEFEEVVSDVEVADEVEVKVWKFFSEVLLKDLVLISCGGIEPSLTFDLQYSSSSENPLDTWDDCVCPISK